MLSTLGPMFGNMRDTVRKAVDVSPSAIRPRNILELPDEILIEIFKHVKDYPRHLPYEARLISPPGHVKDIRLTCRRFCNTSSHLLLDLVCVEMTPQSLAQFEDISRHLLISKAVRTVRVLAHFYNSAMADRFGVFASYHVARMTANIHMPRFGRDYPTMDATTRQNGAFESQSW
jgi:hypothetical protein